jgi:hypothetical protein
MLRRDRPPKRVTSSPTTSRQFFDEAFVSQRVSRFDGKAMKVMLLKEQ